MKRSVLISFLIGFFSCDSGSVYTVDAVMSAATTQAIKAYCQGTFGVGGLLLEKTGTVYQQMHNNVVIDQKLKDPTAHGERQLVDWYFENKKTLNLPKPSDMIIVTSLDPCAMCTGSILQAGFGLAIVAAYDTRAGINYNMKADFLTLAGTSMHEIARSVFSYPEVKADGCFQRKATGALISGHFVEKTISERTQALATCVFVSTEVSVSSEINDDHPPEKLVNPKTSLGPGNIIYDKLIKVYPDALKYTAPKPGQPDKGLAEYLIKAAKEDKANGGDGNAVAFLDFFGNLILCMPGHMNKSEIQTAFLNTTRTYAKLRYELRNSSAGQETLKYLCHPKDGTFIYAKSMKINPQGLMELGAYGSTMEGPIPDKHQLQYCIERVPHVELQAFCDRLPPFYSDVNSINIKISQTKDKELISTLKKELP